MACEVNEWKGQITHRGLRPLRCVHLQKKNASVIIHCARSYVFMINIYPAKHCGILLDLVLLIDPMME